jgi:hypothetical protein
MTASVLVEHRSVADRRAHVGSHVPGVESPALRSAAKPRPPSRGSDPVEVT